MKLFRHFRLLISGLVFCLGALSTNAFALMGGAVQNGGVALGNASGANSVVVCTLAGSAGVIGSTDKSRGEPLPQASCIGLIGKGNKK